ncbi:hypothetical protein Taro_049908 [Colocasia esculenta]|uniref:Uncharacterized protein n=1 Tax=Colocasia esculenta TaxID=4460 RepID=A0A843XCB8_COLES|nr:hypothetical protein [Colocasia esculenta]
MARYGTTVPSRFAAARWSVLAVPHFDRSQPLSRLFPNFPPFRRLAFASASASAAPSLPSYFLPHCRLSQQGRRRWTGGAPRLVAFPPKPAVPLVAFYNASTSVAI